VPTCVPRFFVHTTRWDALSTSATRSRSIACLPLRSVRRLVGTGRVRLDSGWRPPVLFVHVDGQTTRWSPSAPVLISASPCKLALSFKSCADVCNVPRLLHRHANHAHRALSPPSPILSPPSFSALLGRRTCAPPSMGGLRRQTSSDSLSRARSSSNTGYVDVGGSESPCDGTLTRDAALLQRRLSQTCEPATRVETRS
jgi:hypothetical protein